MDNRKKRNRIDGYCDSKHFREEKDRTVVFDISASFIIFILHVKKLKPRSKYHSNKENQQQQQQQINKKREKERVIQNSIGALKRGFFEL